MALRLYSAIVDGGGRRGRALLLALVAATGGVIAIVWAIHSQQSAPEPSSSAAGIISPDRASGNQQGQTAAQVPVGGSGTASAPRPPVSASEPIFIDISAIEVHSDVISIGKAADGTLAVPQPGPDLNKAAWYEESVTPGQAGPSVIEGHIDSVNGPSVFYSLGALHPGNTIRITRRDGSVAIFTVNAVRSYASHSLFPTVEVYGGDLSHATLRLITCSNFDDSSGHYVGNTVVFAHLSALRHTTGG